MNKYIESVSHLKKKLEKGVSYEKTLHILHKLQKIPITIELLHTTGIGKTVRNLSKQHIDTDIGKTAKLLCLTWKAIVKEQREREEEEEQEREERLEYEEPEVSDKEEPAFDESFESKVSTSYDKNDHKIKKEYNGSDDEMNGSIGHSKTDFYTNIKRKNNNNEDLKSDKKHRKHKSSHKSRESEPNGGKTEFEELLGLNDQIIKNNKKIVSNKRSDNEKYSKKDNNSKEKSNKYSKTEKLESNDSRNHSSHSIPKALDSNVRLSSLEHSDILSDLPIHNYKPLPNREVIDERVEANRRKTVKTSEDLSLNVQSKKGRTAVFAGLARTKTYTHVHPLEELCIRVLMDNIDKIWYLGDAPYYLMKPVLQKCNTKQLAKIEKYNSQIMDETDELWEQFCEKEFRGRDPEEDESWRELYYRCGKERDDRLKKITKNITHKQEKALPVRQTQFSENVKTPREILRKQERSGINHSIAGTSSSGTSSSNYVKIVPEKPKVAPLMKKALKLQKSRYRR